ncbi:hypothetical protein [Corynebacterium sp. AOP12-C2-36]|uniref:hypothetical protein n=1 Tax=Corynebacterium sp. AOP12-C2-36 TaxID=3457723 RepID=UPI004034A40F
MARTKAPAKRTRLTAAPVFTGITPAKLKSWTLIIPLVLAAVTTAGACSPDARDSVLERVLGQSQSIQSDQPRT